MATKKEILKNFRIAKAYRRPWLDAAREDFEFALGKQWKDKDKKELEDRGAPALTINKIQPCIFLASGIQRQNRTDFVGYPIGDEDGLIANIVTILLNHVAKNSGIEFKISEQFEDNITCGEGYLEPFIRYEEDLLNGKIHWVKRDAFCVFPDPKFKEYDMSDAKYVCVLTKDLDEDDILTMFPEKEVVIKKIEDGKLKMTPLSSDAVHEGDYDNPNKADPESDNLQDKTKKFDLISYYYQKYAEVYIVADKRLGKFKQATDLKEAKKYEKIMLDQEKKEAAAAGKAWTEQDRSVVVIKRHTYEIWQAFMTGDETILADEACWSFPKWKKYPIFGMFAHRTTTQIKDREYMVQGIVRALKDPQRELNKRRSQELRILNSSANSGWIHEEGAWVDPSKVEDYGATPGIDLEYKKGFMRPEKIVPSPLSQGHAQLAQENTQDIKEISGINTDLLAMQEGGQSSGRAIFLRQKQGLVMIQRIFDNYGQTKQNIGKFILSQLGEVFTVEKAVKALGTKFIKDNFEEPIEDPNNPGMMQLDPVTGQPVMAVNEEYMRDTINKVLADTEVGEYDVAIGEGAHTDTVKFANYSTLLEMQQGGVPVPGEVIVEESMLSESSKTKIKQAIEQAQQAAAAAPAAPAKK